MAQTKPLELLVKVEEPDFGLNTKATWGDVTSVSPLSVRLAGDASSTELVRRLDSYSPVSGDRVVLVKVANTWVIFGKLI